MLKLRDSGSLQVKARGCLYSVCSMCTNICQNRVVRRDIVQMRAVLDGVCNK